MIALGDGVTEFGIGDVVYVEVDTGGAAEMASVKVDAVARIPETLAVVEAAAIPMAGITALRAVREGAGVSVGDSVLVTGASGGVGSFAVQLAVAFGATVTAVVHSRNRDIAVALGAARVIAYDEEDFIESARDFDAVVDISGTRTLATLRSVVRRRGRVVLVGGDGGRLVGPAGRMLVSLVVNPWVSQRLHPVLDSKPNGDDLRTIGALVDRGAVSPLIDSVVPFDRLPEAVERLESGLLRGKVLVAVAGAASDG